MIPCCADHDHFKPVATSKHRDFTLLYLGSLGTWYRTDLLMTFFKKLREYRPDARLLVLSGQDPEIIFTEVRKHDIDISKVSCRSADRDELPQLISECHLSAFFIKDAYSKAASSPTKLAEILACGLPVICNTEVGDLELLQSKLPFMYGCTLDEVVDMDVAQALKRFSAHEAKDITETSRSLFDTKVGVSRYIEVYDMLLSARQS